MSMTCTTENTRVPCSTPTGMGRPKTLLSRFASDERGNIAIIFGLMTITIVTLVGGAVDYGRWLNARSQTQAAIDSALLAAGRAAQTSNGDETLSLAAANSYYAQMKSNITVDDTVHFTAANSATEFSAKGSTYVNTPFLSLIGIEKLPVLKLGDVTQAKSTIAQGGNSGSSVEIGLMLDTTGSMEGQKLVDLKAAATDLVNIVVWDDQSSYTSRIGIAPFSEAVNVGDYFQAVTGQSPNYASHEETYQSGTKTIYQASCYRSDGSVKKSCKSDPSTIIGTEPIYSTRTVVDSTAKATCVVERTGTNEFTETAPGTGSWITTWNSATGSSSTTCPEASPIVPLTSNKTTLKATIDGLVAESRTAGAVGTAWAWYLISPEWNSIFTGEWQAASYSLMSELGINGQPKLQKIAILMTDGAYNEYQGKSANTSTVNSKALSLCSAMKAKGITVYTVGFDLGSDTTALDMLSQCATDPTHFYNAASGDALKAAFRDIALKISALRLSH